MEAVCFPGAPSTLGRALWWDVGGDMVNQSQSEGPQGFSAETRLPEGCFHVGFGAQWGANNPQPKPQALLPNHDTACFLSVLFFRIEIWCLLLILQVERASVPLPAPLHLHPASH